MCITSLWFWCACLTFFSLNSPKKVFLAISLFIKALILTLWRFIFIGPARHCLRAPRSSLVSLQALCHRLFPLAIQKRAVSLSFLNCVQEWIIVASELPTSGFHQVSDLRVDFKSIYFPLPPSAPPLFLTVILCSVIETLQECQCMQMLSPSQCMLAKNMDEKQAW